MGTGARRIRNHDRVTVGKPSSESVSIPRDISPSVNDIFVEETDWEGGGPVVYFSCGNFLLEFGGT